jgi:hypothetical protein
MLRKKLIAHVRHVRLGGRAEAGIRHQVPEEGMGVEK